MNRYRFDNSKDEKGKEKHLHLLDGKPLAGTTTVLDVLKKVLTWWAAGLAMGEFGWVKKLDPRMKDGVKPTKEELEANGQERLTKAQAMLDEIKQMDVEQYLAKLDKGYKAHSVKLDKSADVGTAMHAALELYAKDCIQFFEGKPQVAQDEQEGPVKVFAEWAVENVSKFLCAEGHAFSERLWTGSIFDLLYEDKEGLLVVLDHKSAKEAYYNHFLQDAGCAIAIEENGIYDKDGNLFLDLKGRKVDYYGVFPFGMKNPVPSFHFDTEGAKKGFEACVLLHKLINQK